MGDELGGAERKLLVEFVSIWSPSHVEVILVDYWSITKSACSN